MTPGELTQALKAAAGELGFGPSGVCDAQVSPSYERFLQWLEAGYSGGMHYLPGRSDAYRHPRSVLPQVRSVLMLAFPYCTQEPAAAQPGQGLVSRYAWGEADYHDVIRARLNQLKLRLLAWRPDALARGVVDTAPLLERDFARLAGLGWIGKHTLLIHPNDGSWFFLAALLTDQELEADAPFTTDHCGTCRACLDACPTDAFPQPYVLDATRCISYLTIESREATPDELRGPSGAWVFGCDVCQQVCPWNRRPPRLEQGPLQPRDELNPLELPTLFYLNEEEFRHRFRTTPVWRARRGGLLRNAAIVLGNQRHAAAAPALAHGLKDSEAVVRGACAWALGRIGGSVADQSLADRLAVESDPDVRREIESALVKETDRDHGHSSAAGVRWKRLDD